MKSLESRIAALESLRPAPNIAFVASYEPDGTLIPLKPGTMYGHQVAMVPAPCATAAQWFECYAPRADDREEALRLQQLEAARQRALKAFGGAAVRQPFGEACMRELALPRLWMRVDCRGPARPFMRELTVPLLCRLALNLDPTHRSEILRDYPSLTAWAKSRCDGSAGIGWVLMVRGEPVCAVGIFTVGVAGYLWLAGAHGWTRHIRKLVAFWKAVKTSGAYGKLMCDILVDNPAEKRWVEHLGFSQLGRRGDHLFYGMVL